MRFNRLNKWGRGAALASLSLVLASAAGGDLRLTPEVYVEDAGVPIDVPGYSVPSLADLDDDGRQDLVVGEGSATGKVRIYPNVGTAAAPAFGGYFYAQADGSDLTEPGGGCLGIFPRAVLWDGDGRPDLIAGRSDGTIKLFTNTSTGQWPAFDAGVLLEVGPEGSKVPIDVGSRATATVADWNEDGRKDVVAGGLDGKIHVFLNEGTDDAPDFLVQSFAQEGGSDLLVPSARSSPHVLDFDHDGRKDLLTGNTNGQLLFYANVGTDEAPVFSGYTAVQADGVPIDLPSELRSRPFVCEWNRDGFCDVLIGYGDGLVRIYTGIEHYHDSSAPEGENEAAVVKLAAPRPNPTAGRSVLAFDLPSGQVVRIAIHDVSGRCVAELADSWFGPGTHELVWDGLDSEGRTLSSGIYFVLMEAGTARLTKRLVLLR